MAGLTFVGSANGDIGLLRARLERLSKDAIGELTKALGEEGKDLVFQGFASSTSPDGQAWAPPKFRSGMPLMDTDILRSSVNVRIGSGSFTLGASQWYGAVHQYGAKIRVKSAKSLYSAKLKRGFGKQVTIPARPWLPTGGLPASWKDAFQSSADDYFELVLGGK